MSRFSSTAALRARFLVLAAILLMAAAVRCPANSIVEIALPTPGADPETIVYGPDGAYWFVETEVGQIGRITTNGVVTEYPINLGFSEPLGITVGPDSNLWFTEYNIDRVARITTNGVITQYPLPAGIYPTCITRGPDQRLWVIDFGTPSYVVGTPTNGGILALTLGGTNGLIATNYYNSNLTVHSRPGNIITGPDANLYFTEQLAGRIGKITTNGAITESPYFPTNCQPWDIIPGPDGALWFTEANSNKLGRIDTTLTITNEYLLPTNFAGLTLDYPGGLIVGPDKNFWYTDPPASCITQVVLNGTNLTYVTNTTYFTNIVGSSNVVTTNISTNLNATQFFTPSTNSAPRRLASGADSNIWFGEFVGAPVVGYQNNIGKFIFPAPLNIQFTFPNVIISWTTNITTNYVLQTNSDLTTMNWGFVTNVPAIVTNLNNTNIVNYVVTNTFTNPPSGNLFFRLIN